MGYEEEDRRADGAAVHQARLRHGVGKRSPNPAPRSEVNRISGAITALTDAADDQHASMQRSTRTRPGFSLGRKIETRRIKEVSQ